jgi:hypothetical protein
LSEGVPFPRDALIDHLAAINGWELESVIDYDETDKVAVNWTATYNVRRALYIPSVTGIVTVSEMRQKWAPVGDPCFTVYHVTFNLEPDHPKGDQWFITRNSADIAAVAYSRLERK